VTDLEIPSRCWTSWIPGNGEPRSVARELTAEERRAVEHRATSLAAWLAPYARPSDDDDVTIALAEMFNGFPSMRNESGQAALARVNAAMELLAQFPAWAIVAGCAQIRRKGYEVAERDGVRVERHWPPGEPELYRVVELLVAPRVTAMRNARLLLAAPVEPQLEESPEHKAAVADRVRAAVRPVTSPELESALTARNSRRAELATKRRDADLRAQYAAAGVEVPDGYLVSLPMRLAQGWTIEEVGHRKVLVKPRPRPVEPRETQPWEMGR
jgi:hypothetical protein